MFVVIFLDFRVTLFSFYVIIIIWVIERNPNKLNHITQATYFLDPSLNEFVLRLRNLNVEIIKARKRLKRIIELRRH